jgi:predicted nucleotide-binding protein
MDEQTIGSARDAIVAQIKELEVIREKWKTNPADAEKAFGLFREALHRQLGRMLLQSPAEIFAAAEGKPNSSAKAAVYRLLLARLRDNVVSRPSAILRERPIGLVFIVHGHDELNMRRLQSMLEKGFHLETKVMMEEPPRGQTLLEKLERLSEGVQYAVVLCTPDDELIQTRGSYRQPRPNVLVELGFFAGRLGRENTTVLLREGTTLPTDYGGFNYIAFRENVEEKAMALKGELAAAGLLSPD